MADNIAIKDGTGTAVTVAADDISSVYYPRHKLSLGADGTANDASAGAGAVGTGTQRVTLGSDDPAVTSLGVMDDWDETDACKTRGTMDVISVTLTLDTSAYANGDLLADAQTFTFARANDGQAKLVSMMVIDEDDQGAAFDVYLTNVATSWGTENSAPTITDAVARSIQTKIAVATADYTDLGGVKVAAYKNIGAILKSISGAQTIAVAVVNGTGTPTYTASGVKLVFGFEY